MVGEGEETRLAHESRNINGTRFIAGSPPADHATRPPSSICLLRASCPPQDRLGTPSRRWSGERCEGRAPVGEGGRRRRDKGRALCGSLHARVSMATGWGGRSRRRRARLTLVKWCVLETGDGREGEDGHSNSKEGRRGAERRRVVSVSTMCTRPCVELLLGVE